MNADYRDFFVTVRISETQTRDYRVRSHSAHGARAQHLQKHPGAKITGVRYCTHNPSDPQD
jgi:hypothetical protein